MQQRELFRSQVTSSYSWRGAYLPCTRTCIRQSHSVGMENTGSTDYSGEQSKQIAMQLMERNGVLCVTVTQVHQAVSRLAMTILSMEVKTNVQLTPCQPGSTVS